MRTHALARRPPRNGVALLHLRRIGHRRLRASLICQAKRRRAAAHAPASARARPTEQRAAYLRPAAANRRSHAQDMSSALPLGRARQHQYRMRPRVTRSSHTGRPIDGASCLAYEHWLTLAPGPQAGIDTVHSRQMRFLVRDASSTCAGGGHGGTNQLPMEPPTRVQLDLPDTSFRVLTRSRHTTWAWYDLPRRALRSHAGTHAGLAPWATWSPAVDRPHRRRCRVPHAGSRAALAPQLARHEPRTPKQSQV